MSAAKTISGYHLKRSKGLNHWDDLLQEWLGAHKKYCSVMKDYDYDDSAYWYTEIPNVSILNAAAWRCGRIALQEFKTEKKIRGKEPWTGRGDLWIYTGSVGKEESIEAKHKFVPLSAAKEKNGLPTAIKESMKEATKDAKKAKGGYHYVTALAVVFASVSAAPTTPTDEIDQQIIDFCEGIKSSRDYHALAWCFPKETRELQNKKGYYYPGIVMLVKNINTKYK